LIWKLLKKDILRRVKNPGGFVLLLIMPFLFALIVGLAFGPSGGGQKSFRVTLLVEDRDNSFASQMLRFAFGQGELAKIILLQPVHGDTGRQLLEEGKASALLIIPRGFGDSLLHQKKTDLVLVKNPSESFGPKIAEETVRLFAEAGDRLVRIAAEPLAGIGKRTDSNKAPPDAEVALISVQISHLVNRVSLYLFPPKIALNMRSVSVRTNENAASNFYAANVSRMMVMCLLFLLDVLLRDLYEEKENHTLVRLRTGPVGVELFILSKMAFALLSGLAACAFVWTGVVLMFGVRMDAVQVLTFVPFSFILIAALTGVALLIHAFSRSRSQAQALSPAVIIVFSMLGGCMIPVEALPPFMQKAAVVSPVYWGVNGLQRIMLERANLFQLMLHVLVLSSVACVFLTFSFFMIRRKILK
jgi:ABC-2 type transport system permease protein